MSLKRGKRTTEKEPTPETENPDPTPQEEAAGAEQEQEQPPFETEDPEAVAEQEKEAKEEADQAAQEAAAKAALAGKGSTSRGLAEKPATTAVATTSKPKDNVMAALEDDGMEGLELGFGSFPTVKLENEGIFADTEDNEYGKSLQCIIFTTKSKFVLKNTKCENKDEEALYTYDRVTCTNEELVQDVIDEWAGQGWGYEFKPYLDAPAQIVGGEFDGEMVMLSIPPASKNRLSGYFYTNRMKNRGPSKGYVTECFVGKKIANDKGDFYPWKFKYIGVAEED